MSRPLLDLSEGGGTVLVRSGFHSPVECDVFQILTRRGANLIWVPGRDIPKVIPAAMPKLLAQNRLLVASPFDYGKPDRPTRATCLRRNEWIARAVSVGELSLTSASPGPD